MSARFGSQTLRQKVGWCGELCQKHLRKCETRWDAWLQQSVQSAQPFSVDSHHANKNKHWTHWDTWKLWVISSMYEILQKEVLFLENPSALGWMCNGFKPCSNNCNYDMCNFTHFQKFGMSIPPVRVLYCHYTRGVPWWWDDHSPQTVHHLTCHSQNGMLWVPLWLMLHVWNSFGQRCLCILYIYIYIYIYLKYPLVI